MMKYTFKDEGVVNWNIEENEEDIDINKMNSLKLIGFDIEETVTDDEETYEGVVKFKDDKNEYVLEIEIEEGCISLNVEDVFKDNYSETEISCINEWFENFVKFIKCFEGEE